MFTIEELRRLIDPIAERYGKPLVHLFGSYARGEATENSDIDLFIDPNGMPTRDCYALAYDVEEATGKRIDVRTPTSVDHSSAFWRTIQSEMVLL